MLFRSVSGGGFASTTRTAKRANSGPAIAAVGMPMTKPQNSTRPMFAFSAATATTGPGWGGISPCMTDMHDSSGSVSFRNGCLVSWVSVSRIGSSSTKPTANQVVRPTASASAITHHWIRFGPKNDANPLASTSAPPDSARSFPSIVPRPITAAIPAITLPSPVENDFTTPTTVSDLAAHRRRPHSPTISDASSSEMNALTLNRVTRTTSAPIATRATRISLRSAGVTDAQSRTKAGANEQIWL